MNRISEIDQQIAALIEERRIIVKNDITNLKAGDYVVCIKYDGGLNVGEIYTISQAAFDWSFNPNRKIFTITEFSSRYFTDYFRPATNQEIDSYLIKVANKLGFVVGAKVRWKDEFYGHNFYPIESLHVYRGDNADNVSSMVLEEYEKNKTVVYVRYERNRCKYNLPLSFCMLEPKLPDIKINLDNVEYIADFKDGYVEFGCAKIDNGIFIDALKFIKSGNNKKGNKYVNAIQIGKDLFTNDLIMQIADRINGQNK